MFNLNRMATIPQQLLARADSQGAVHYSTLYLRPLPFYDDRLLSIKEGGGGGCFLGRCEERRHS